MKRIVVHGGRSHLDDVMACAMAMMSKCGVVEHATPSLMSSGPVPIERRDPTADELDDPDVLVMDVGRRHQPELGNFDHHQLERSDCRCSMYLLACAIMSDERTVLADEMARIFPWWDTAVTIDQQGPYTAAAKHGLEWSQVVPFIGPLAGVYLRRFADDTLSPGERGEFVYNTLTRWLEDRLCAWRDVDSHLTEHVVNGTHVVDLTGVAYKPHCEEAAASVVASHGWRTGVLIYVASPRREGETWDNTGLTLVRIGDDMSVDFTKGEDEPGVVFAHKGGFLAQVASRDVEKALRLVSIATGE